MTATSATTTPPPAALRGAEPFTDALTITWRNLVNLRRNPQLLVFATVQPVIFVLMFRYVFGGQIKIPGVRYVDYLMPGIFSQTVTFGSLQTGVGLADEAWVQRRRRRAGHQTTARLRSGYEDTGGLKVPLSLRSDASARRAQGVEFR